MNQMQEGLFFYGRNFLHFMHKDEGWIYLGVVTLLLGGLAYCAFRISQTSSIASVRRESHYWLVVAMIAIFMMVYVSKPLWDILPVLQRIQFPWRFNTILTVATTALLALGISSVKKNIFLNQKALGIGILLITSLILSVIQALPLLTKPLLNLRLTTVVIVTFTVLVVLGISLLKKPVDFSNEKALVIAILLITSLILSGTMVIKIRLLNTVDVDTALEISRDASEYRPRWVSKDLFQPNSLSQLDKDFPQAWITVGQGSLVIQQWKPREIILQANAITDVWLNIHQFYYPGWVARLKGESHLLAVQPSEQEGLLRVRVPMGKHEVIVKLNVGVEERAGQIISAASAIIAVSAMFWFRRVPQDE